MVTDLLRAELRAMNVHPVAAGHRGRPHPLVPQLTGGAMAKKRAPEARRPRSR